jgi:hypothetical protein
MAAGHEVVLEFSKLAIEHTASLWTIASGFVALEVLIIAQVLIRTRAPFRQRVTLLLSVSTAANVFSMISGYIADAGVLNALKVYASSGTWNPSVEGEVFNLIQMAMLTVGLVVFVAVFLFYSRILADNLVRTGGLAGGNGKGADGST